MVLMIREVRKMGKVMLRDETESPPNVYAKNRLTKIIIKRLTI